MGRVVCAVPGRITTPQSSGPNVLLQQGAHLVTGAQDVLDALYGAGSRTLIGQGRPEPDPELRPWLDAVAAGHDTAEALARAGLAPERTLEVLSELELSGHVRRVAGGRFAVVPCARLTNLVNVNQPRLNELHVNLRVRSA